MTSKAEVARIAAGLSGAQRRWLVERARQGDPYCEGRLRWMTFPPPNTHKVLMQLGLVDKAGVTSKLGGAVRNHLQEAGDA